MSETTKPRRRIKLWQLLLGIAAVSLTLALMPNHRLGEMIFVCIEATLLVALLVLLVIALIRKLAKR
jgi:hypothetical protein